MQKRSGVTGRRQHQKHDVALLAGGQQQQRGSAGGIRADCSSGGRRISTPAWRRRFPWRLVLILAGLILPLAATLLLLVKSIGTNNDVYYGGTPSPTPKPTHQPTVPPLPLRYYKVTYYNDTQKKKLLIAQYGDDDTSASWYESMLEISTRVNKAYAKYWGQDYVLVRGIYLGSRETPSRSTYNKIAILFHAMEHEYDRVLLLDSDALMYNFEAELASRYLNDSMLLSAQAVREGGWNINIGVTLWNVHHPAYVGVLERWKAECLFRIRRGWRDDDQFALHNVLRTLPEPMPVERTYFEFGYRQGRIVKHFNRPTGLSWNDSEWDPSLRLDEMIVVEQEVCQRYFPICENE